MRAAAAADTVRVRARRPRSAAGVWVENGVISHPVSECTIAGNLRDMLRGFIAANDARAHLSRRVPSLLIDGMTIAGG